jgi:hypothetical protein
LAIFNKNCKFKEKYNEMFNIWERERASKAGVRNKRDHKQGSKAVFSLWIDLSNPKVKA